MMSCSEPSSENVAATRVLRCERMTRNRGVNGGSTHSRYCVVSLCNAYSARCHSTAQLTLLFGGAFLGLHAALTTLSRDDMAGSQRGESC